MSNVLLRLLARRPGVSVNDGKERFAGRRFALLAYLHLGPQVASRDELCELLWEPEAGKDPQARLRQLILETKKSLPKGILRTEGRTVSVDRERISSDVIEFQKAVGEARWADAAKIYEADFLSGATPIGASEFVEWADTQSRSLRRQLAAALDELIDDEEALGHYQAAADAAARLFKLTPTDTRARQMLSLLLRAGNTKAGLAAIADVESFLTGQNVRPSGELTAIIQSARQAKPLPTNGDTSEKVPTHKNRKPMIAVSTVVLIIAALTFVKLSASSADVFAHGQTLTYIDADNTRHTLRFYGPLATDTATTFVGARDSIPDFVTRVSPTGDLIMENCVERRSDDRQLCVRNIRTGVSSILTHRHGDNDGLAWSPDSRWILFQASRTDANKLQYSIYALNARTGHYVRLNNDSLQGYAVWSADGTRIGIVLRNGIEDRVIVRTVDGALLFDQRYRGTGFLRPSPDGRWISYSNDSSLILLGVRGQRTVATPLRRITSGAWAEDGKTVAIAGYIGNDPYVEVCSVDDCTHPLLLIRSAREPAWSVSKAKHFIASVEVVPSAASPYVGDNVALNPIVLDADGNRVRPSILNHKVIDTTLAWVDSLGILHTLAPSLVRVVTSTGGWRIDTLFLRVRPRPRLAAILNEDFEHGLDTTRWVPYGNPLPFIEEYDGGHAFNNGGDDNYPSGIVTRSDFSIARGFTLEWRQKTPLTGENWQEIWINFSTAPADSFIAAPGEPFPHKSLTFGINSPIDMYVPPVPWLYAGCGNPGADGRYPERLKHGWHSFVYQMHPDNQCEFIVDGRVMSQSRAPLDMAKRYRLMVGGRSYHTHLLIDDVRLYSGIKWVLAQDHSAILAKP